MNTKSVVFEMCASSRVTALQPFNSKTYTVNATVYCVAPLGTWVQFSTTSPAAHIQEC